ncbi:MAG: ribosome small subunit-dependent GTPase A [Gammaproteobacteria bacterium]|nr:ribosome small subunit-dependent GTPase A [Gammaproteobacteria bacterium]NNF67576.1 ribosome small subunit-dependent GTPase A [Gammaproteobacteria bacterium]
MSAADRDDELLLTGRVVAAYGRQVIVEDPDRQRFRCKMKGKRMRPVCADDVEWRLEQVEGGDGVVTRILPRRSELARPDARGRAEVIAANITQLVIVVAPKPAADLSLVDRYLVSAELIGVDAVVVANKNDLGSIDLRSFQQIDYATVSVCAKKPASLTALTALMIDHTSIFVGQSGVGKSSLLNTMIPGLDSRTQTLSASSGDGRHTTTASMLHHLDNEGEVIDSPGVRDFAPPPISDRELSAGFVEFREPSTTCRFNDCRHLSEPDCGVRLAVEKGQISTRRYDSYTHLLERLARINPDSYS